MKIVQVARMALAAAFVAAAMLAPMAPLAAQAAMADSVVFDVAADEPSDGLTTESGDGDGETEEARQGHDAGIKVYVDVVYNAETGDDLTTEASEPEAEHRAALREMILMGATR